ncbi:MAG TPA: hypothetical protein VMT52_18610 [Planctomycetota bacterium]|nr:hypothetical protein [Planctomycetota bacterium]
MIPDFLPLAVEGLVTDWPAGGRLWIPAILGAALALGTLALIRLAGRLRRRSGGAANRVDAEALDEGLRAFAREVEVRLDLKIDRLERLLAEARSVLPRPGIDEVDSTSSAEADGPMSTVSAGDRERVLKLAELGKMPEAIAGSVGLLRGEVDLILRLHRSAGRIQNP